MMTEAEMEVARKRPYPTEVMRTSAMIERRRARLATEPLKVYRPVAEERPAESLGAAIQRKAKVTRRRRAR